MTADDGHDMHEDNFNENPHGCAVQMLLKSFTKRPGGTTRANGNTAHVAVFKDPKPGQTGRTAVEQIQDELDACFEEEGYVEGTYPFESGGRNDSCTSQMIFRFCKRRTAKGQPVKCAISHRNQKIFEFAPPDLKRSTYTPTILFSIHGDHAYF